MATQAVSVFISNWILQESIILTPLREALEIFMRNIKAIASVAAVSAVVAVFWFSGDEVQTVELNSVAPVPMLPQSDFHDHHDHGNRDTSVLEQDLPKHLSTGVDMFIANSPSEDAPMKWMFEKDSIVWQRSEKSEEVLKAQGFQSADLANEIYLEIDVDELRAVEVGEYLDLYIPQIEGSYSGEVDYITEHDNGDRTVEAHIPGAGSLFSAVITIGEEAIYGTLGTQDDVYIMEGNGQYAWIASKSDLVANHSKTHVDGIIPDENTLENIRNSQTGGDAFSVKAESP